jgi:hypothetical protein
VDALPTAFVDRSLGRVQVPQLLRAAGVELVTLAEHYDVRADEQVTDVTWIAESAGRDARLPVRKLSEVQAAIRAVSWRTRRPHPSVADEDPVGGGSCGTSLN